jgi:hypothetical protein
MSAQTPESPGGTTVSAEGVPRMIVRPGRLLPSVIAGAFLAGSLALGAGTAFAADGDTTTPPTSSDPVPAVSVPVVVVPTVTVPAVPLPTADQCVWRLGGRPVSIPPGYDRLASGLCARHQPTAAEIAQQQAAQQQAAQQQAAQQQADGRRPGTPGRGEVRPQAWVRRTDPGEGRPAPASDRSTSRGVDVRV